MITKAAGIFLVYFAGMRGVLLIELLFVIPLVIFVAFGGALFYGIVVSIVGFAAVATASLNTCFEKYFAVIPIKHWARLLAEYAFFLMFAAAGVVIAVVCAIIAGGGFVPSLNVILFVLGYVLTAFGFIAVFWPIIKSWVFFLLPLPIAQLYLVLGVSQSHELFTAGATTTPVADVYVFGNTPIWLVFIAVSLVIFTGSYFVTFIIERNQQNGT